MQLRSRFALLLLLLVLPISACDDPSSAGLELVGSGEGLLVQTTLPATSADTASLSVSPLTGGLAPGSQQSSGVSRALMGSVRDPLFGAITATGYLDFSVNEAPPTRFLDSATVRSATLELDRSYLYGDSIQTVSVQLRDMPTTWSPSGARADTSLEAGAPIATYQLSPADSSFSMELPADWIARNDTTLRSRNFASVFHGFQLHPEAGNAVVGVQGSSGRLQVITDQDTVLYPVSQLLTTLRRTPPPESPRHRLPLQSGVGPEVHLPFSFDTTLVVQEGEKKDTLHTTLKGQGVNGATLYITPDTTRLNDTPAQFARPSLQNLSLFGVFPNGDEVLLVNTSERTESGTFRFSSPSLRQALQAVLLGEETFSHFRLSPALRQSSGGRLINPVSISPTLLYESNAACADDEPSSCGPRLHLTLTLTSR